MSSDQFISYSNFLRCAKKLGKRFGIPLQRAQALLCRVCGFTGMYELQKHAQGFVPIEPIALQDWVARLRAELGSDLDELVSEEERGKWFRYIHPRRDHAK